MPCQHSKVNQWSQIVTNAVEQTLGQLTKLGKTFKYTDLCNYAADGVGLHPGSSCFWYNSANGEQDHGLH